MTADWCLPNQSAMRCGDHLHPAVIALCLVLSVGTAVAKNKAVNEGQVLARWGGVEVSQRDLKAYTLNLPPAARQRALTSREKLSQALQNILVRKMLVQQARSEDVHKRQETRLRLRQARQDVMVKEWQRLLLDRKSQEVDFKLLAREKYRANLDDYKLPERRDVTHILVRTGTRDEQAARARISEAKRRIEQGEIDFEQAVAEYSEGPAAENNDGRIERVKPGQMVPAFDEALFSLDQAGDWTGPVETPYGFHLVRLDAIHPSKERPFSAVREQLIQSERERYRDKQWKQHLAELQEQAGQPQFETQGLEAVIESHSAESSAGSGDEPEPQEVKQQ